jgi:hypothetical protein
MGDGDTDSSRFARLETGGDGEGSSDALDVRRDSVRPRDSGGSLLFLLLKPPSTIASSLDSELCSAAVDAAFWRFKLSE